jgi:hypothetical protein
VYLDPSKSHYYVAQKPDQAPVYQSLHNLSRTGARLQKSVETKPYVKSGHMSNQQKAEFVDDIFCIQSFWEGHGKISPKT